MECNQVARWVCVCVFSGLLACVCAVCLCLLYFFGRGWGGRGGSVCGRSDSSRMVAASRHLYESVLVAEYVPVYMICVYSEGVCVCDWV